MVKTKREYILATFFLSGIASILSFVSLGTQQWVLSDGKWTINLDQINTIKFGLFLGTFRQRLPSDTVYELTMTCLMDRNVCALLCGSSEDIRYEQLRNLFDNKPTSFDLNCPSIDRMNLVENRFNLDDSISSNKQFLNAGIWVCTIFFVCLSAVVGLISAGLALWNTTSNPIEYYFSIFGLYIYNTIGLFSSLLVVLLWGVMFGKTIIHNVAIYYTLVGQMSTDERAYLGFSYWINLAALVCFAVNISLLYIRQYLISKMPECTVYIENSSDPVIYLY